MVAYAVVQVDIQDAELFESYRVQVPAIIKQFGGRYLARGGAFDVLCGQWPVARTIILEFPSLGGYAAEPVSRNRCRPVCRRRCGRP